MSNQKHKVKFEGVGSKRSRTDSIIGDINDEYANYEAIKYESKEKWQKIQKLMTSPDSQVVLFSVPKGFDISKMNTLKTQDGQNVDFRRKIKKGNEQVYGNIEGDRTCMLEVQTQKGSQQTSHVNQIAALLPGVSKGLLKSVKGLDAYLSLSVFPTDDTVDTRLKNTVS